MPEPLTIYECPSGHVGKPAPWPGDGKFYCGQCMDRGDATEVVPISVFREADVRPLWDASSAAVHMGAVSANNGYVMADTLGKAQRAFPAPEDWTADAVAFTASQKPEGPTHIYGACGCTGCTECEPVSTEEPK